MNGNAATWTSLESVWPEAWLLGWKSISRGTAVGLQEVRVAIGRPVALIGKDGETYLGASGITGDSRSAIHATADDMNKMLDVIFESSVYAHSDELRQGFLTLPGGHRVGFAGHVVTEGGQIRTMKYISALNVRLAKPVLGCGENVLPHLYSGGRLCSTLLVSPPQAGKTTLLRDLARLVSEKGLRTVVVDERGELAGCYHGIPQLDVGPRTDVLDACPKVDGVIMALRALSPQLIVTDEVGREADAIALQEAANAGVAVFASAHGRSIPELHRRPGLAMMLKAGSFERIIVLSSRLGPGTIEEIKTIPSPSN